MDEISVRTATLLQVIHGMDVSAYDPSFFRATLERRSDDLGLADSSAYPECLKDDPEEAARLDEALRISYSRFFRDPLSFAMLECRVLPELLARKPEGGEIRVWSAGCASGQEAYSIAILLDEAIRTSRKSLRYHIFATDANEACVASAREGLFTPDDLKDVKLGQLETCFDRVGGAYSVVPRLRQYIDFSVHDLLDRTATHPPDSIYGDFDVVFCSNVLYYYRNVFRTLILERLSRSLSASGVLFTDATEKSFLSGHASFHPLDPAAPVFVKRAHRFTSK